MRKPACQPVRLVAWQPSSFRAMASSAMLISSPAASSISISRAEGLWVISAAFAIRSSVVSPCADTTTTTSLPALWVLATMRATLKIRFRSFTEEPPNFCTINAIVCHSPLIHSTVAPVLSASSRSNVNASHPSRPSRSSSPFSSLE